MITHEECNTARGSAVKNLEKVKAAEASIQRKAVPIYAETDPGRVIGHRLVKVGYVKPKPTINDMKRCSKCGVEKAPDQFYASKRARDGLQSWCIACKKETIKRPKVDQRPVPVNASSAPTPCKHDEGKLRYDLCPAEWFEGLAEVMTDGLKKYKAESWRGVEPVRYEAAMMRHLTAFRKGEANDPESGLSHLKHIMANAAILLSITGNK